MRFDILTLFPEAFDSFTTTSIIKRAIEANIIQVNCYNIRDFAENKHKKVDDVPYGGGAGMVMMPQPLFDSIEFVKGLIKDKTLMIYMTPSNNIFDQEMAESFSKKEIPDAFKDTLNNEFDRIILLCGHYEGIDQRVIDKFVDIELSIGNFVLTGGELPAQIFIDGIARLIPGVLGKPESHEEESFSKKIGRKNIEYPHYTRPENFQGIKVPEILLSGHHAKIEEWRKLNYKNIEI